MKPQPAIFEEHEIRRVYDEATETWWFSVVDIVQVLTQQPDHQAARKYWNKLKERLGKEGSESVTNCHRLKFPAADGKNYLTDAATAETLLRLVQSVPSPKAEPIKLWLTKVGYERMLEACRVTHFTRSNNRSVLGPMNDFRFHVGLRVEQGGGLASVDLVELHHKLNRIPFSAIGYRYPVEQLQEYLGQEPG